MSDNSQKVYDNSQFFVIYGSFATVKLGVVGWYLGVVINFLGVVRKNCNCQTNFWEFSNTNWELLGQHLGVVERNLGVVGHICFFYLTTPIF